MGKLATLVGAQYGSEGKGVVAKYLANDYDYHVRVGGPNAGHSFCFEGRLYKMQAIPCGWVNPNAILVLGRAAVVNPRILVEELGKLPEGVKNRLWIDDKCTPLLEHHEAAEGHTQGEIHKRIGSTGEGVGAARMERMKRDPTPTSYAPKIFPEELQECFVPETSALLNTKWKMGKNILLEGTQGCGLSFIHGPWPYVTSHDTNAAQLLADVGFAPHLLDESILVARTMPIRVAGNSGPLSNETSWGTLSKTLGKTVEEKTTVTKLVRRLGAWDETLIDNAIRLNGPSWIALTFMDYVVPEDEHVTKEENLSAKSRSFIDYVERRFGVPVGLVGTGFHETRGWSCVDRRNHL